MLAEVRRHTQRAVEAVDALEAGGAGAPAAALEAREDQVRGHVSRWMREMEALGVEVRGAWRVEFETAEGAFCWAWPEPRLRFRARGADDATPIQ